MSDEAIKQAVALLPELKRLDAEIKKAWSFWTSLHGDKFDEEGNKTAERAYFEVCHSFSRDSHRQTIIAALEALAASKPEAGSVECNCGALFPNDVHHSECAKAGGSVIIPSADVEAFTPSGADCHPESPHAVLWKLRDTAAPGAVVDDERVERVAKAIWEVETNAAEEFRDGFWSKSRKHWETFIPDTDFETDDIFRKGRAQYFIEARAALKAMEKT